MAASWDRLREPPSDDREPDREADEGEAGKTSPPLIILLAAAWGDLVALLMVCTASLVALVALGHRVAVACLPWAVALAIVWWVSSSAVLLVVRRGTPGMLMAGVVFSQPVPPRRVTAVVAVSLVVCLTLGMTAVLGSRMSPQGVAAGSPLRLLG